MAKLVALLNEARKLGLKLLQVMVLSAPGQQTIGSRDRMTGKCADDNKRQRRKYRAPDQTEALLASPHGTDRRITKPL